MQLDTARVLVCGLWTSIQMTSHGAEAALRVSVEAALATAAAYIDTSHTYQRSNALQAVADAIGQDAASFADLICEETGKPVKLARAEVARAVETLRHSGHAARALTGQYGRVDTEPRLAGTSAIVSRMPRGPVLCITPANAPLNLLAHKLGPAVAVGAPAIVKPDPRAVRTAAALCDLFLEHGVAPEAISLLAVDNSCAERIVADPRIAVLSFTGSSVGWRLKALNPRAHAVLELGGNAAVVVHADADVELAARQTASGAFVGGGQSCISAQRILVQRDVHDEFLRLFVQEAEALVVGPSEDPATDIGPLPRDVCQRHQETVADAVAKGAVLRTGGVVEGDFVRPAVLSWSGALLRAWDDEMFAPLALVTSYDRVDDAVALLNRTRFGIHAGLFTNDIRVAMQVFEQANVSGIVLNDSSDFRVDALPYGGVKESGTGREGPVSAMEEYTVPRTLILRGLS